MKRLALGLLLLGFSCGRPAAECTRDDMCVRGSGGVTYGNAFAARSAHVAVVRLGPCSSNESLTPCEPDLLR